MAVAFDTIKAGDELFDVHPEKAGHTTARRMGCWPVYVKTVDTANRRALVSWNGNTATWKGAAYFAGSNIRRWPPEWLRDPFAGAKCARCYQTKEHGHAEHCDHPKAIAARKESTK
jgi:hypothetical protein